MSFFLPVKKVLMENVGKNTAQRADNELSREQSFVDRAA